MIWGKRSDDKLLNNPISKVSVDRIQQSVSAQIIVTTKLKGEPIT